MWFAQNVVYFFSSLSFFLSFRLLLFVGFCSCLFHFYLFNCPSFFFFSTLFLSAFFISLSFLFSLLAFFLLFLSVFLSYLLSELVFSTNLVLVVVEFLSQVQRGRQLPVVDSPNVCTKVKILSWFSLLTRRCRCAIPGLDNDTWRVQGVQHAMLVNASIPRGHHQPASYSSCTLYTIITHPQLSENGGGWTAGDWTGGSSSQYYNGTAQGRNRSSGTEGCGRYVYDESVYTATISTEVEFVATLSPLKIFFFFFCIAGCLNTAVERARNVDWFGDINSAWECTKCLNSSGMLLDI